MAKRCLGSEANDASSTGTDEFKNRKTFRWCIKSRKYRKTPGEILLESRKAAVEVGRLSVTAR